MSLTIPTPRIRGRRPPGGWSETDAVALTVAGVTSIHLQPATVRAVVTESLHRHGGLEGVLAELARQLADSPVRTARTLDWARRTVATVTTADGGSVVMCETRPPAVLSSVAASAVGLTGAGAAWRTCRGALALGGFIAAAWIWPLTVGVGATVLAGVAATGYVLGAAREHPLPARAARPAADPAAGAKRVAELKRLTRRTHGERELARAARAELEQREHRAGQTLEARVLPGHPEARVLPGHITGHDQEGAWR